MTAERVIDIFIQLGPAIAGIGAVVATVVIAIIGNFHRKALAETARRSKIEAQLSSDRRELYAEILRPFVTIVTPDAVWNADPRTRGKNKVVEATKLILSNKYVDTRYQLVFVGSDDVVRAFNELMQEFYHLDPTKENQVMPKFAALLLAIRKGAGNDATTLDKWEMLEPFTTDVREAKKQFEQ